MEKASFKKNHIVTAQGTFLNDLLTGDLAGKPFGQIPLSYSVAAGIMYAMVALGALFIAL